MVTLNEVIFDMKELLVLFLTFAKVGVMTFGGGYAMLPILQREVVENKGWATDEELTDYFAIGQCTPGVIAVNTATFIGQKQRGIAGGIVATLGVVFPSLVIISALAGAAVVERLFNIPGMGSLMVDSIEKRDYQVIQAITLLIAMLNVFINLIIDLIYGLADPRIRLD